MTRFDEPDSLSGDLSHEEARSSGAPFDPLFDPWEERERPQAQASSYDDLFAIETAPPLERGDVFVPKYDPESAWRYPDRYQPLYEERLTELQQRLRESAVTVPHPAHNWTVTIRELAETLLLAALIFLAVRASFQNFRVEGASMQPSLEDGEYLIVNKLNYAEVDLGFLDWLPFYDSGDTMHHLWGQPARGDVIVFRAPTAINRDFIKRVIGVPGDHVEILQGTGQVRVNGKVLDEPYIQGTTACNSDDCVIDVPAAKSAEAQASCGSDECYFVMGDNRQNSSDSRQGWLVPKENIIGKALVTYWHEGGPNIGLAPNHSVSYAEGDD